MYRHVHTQIGPLFHSGGIVIFERAYFGTIMVLRISPSPERAYSDSGEQTFVDRIDINPSDLDLDAEVQPGSQAYWEGVEEAVRERRVKTRFVSSVSSDTLGKAAEFVRKFDLESESLARDLELALASEGLSPG